MERGAGLHGALQWSALEGLKAAEKRDMRKMKEDLEKEAGKCQDCRSLQIDTMWGTHHPRR